MFVPNKKVIPFYLFMAFCASCANVKAPTGGPKDEKAPQLMRSWPTQNKTNVTGKIVELEFDENIELNDLNTQLLITPHMENKFVPSVKKKKLQLTFEQDFPSNTTISLNFREGIRDIHETTNTTKELRLAFSTGNAIDSIRLTGTVKDFLTQKPADKVTVALYKASDSLNIRKKKPYYFAQTDASGNYQLTNIQADTYFIAAFDDKNKNLLLDEKSEKVGYLEENLEIKANQTTDIQLFTSKDEQPKYINQRNAGNSVVLSFNKGIASVHSYKSSVPSKFELSKERNEVKIYPQNVDKLPADSVNIGLTIIDSSDNQLIVNKRVLFTSPKNVDKQGLLSVTPQGGTAISPTTEIVFRYDSPIKDTTFIQKIKVQADSTDWKSTKAKLSNFNNTLTIKDLPKFQKTINLIVPPVKLYKGIEAKADTLFYTLADESNFGSIAGEVASFKQKFIVELLDENYQVVRTLANQSVFKFTYLPPAKYYLRVIEDKNGNGRWDTGSLNKRTLPENIVIHKELIQLKANWELTDFKL
jgi:hypothetical protein